MDYKEKVVALLNSQELSKEQKEKLEEIFPQLKESEDEKVRKSIIKFLIDVNNGAYTKSELEIASWVAWLEKQGAHAKFRKAIQIGDKVTRNQDGELVNLSQLKRVAKKGGKK